MTEISAKKRARILDLIKELREEHNVNQRDMAYIAADYISCIIASLSETPEMVNGQVDVIMAVVRELSEFYFDRKIDTKLP